MCKIHSLLTILGLLVLILRLDAGTIPSDIPRCKAGDVTCIGKSITHVIRNNAHGRPEIGLTDIEPLLINEVILSQAQGRSALNLDLRLNQVQIYGLSQGIVDRVVGFETDPNTSKFEIYGNIPKFEIKGRYKTNGQILILPITGDGDIFLSCSNCKASVKFKPSVTTRNGKTYLGVSQIKVKMEPQKVQIRLDNLFNGDKALGDNMNKFLNDNWQDVWKELSPQINDALARVLKTLITDILNKISYDDFYIP